MKKHPFIFYECFIVTSGIMPYALGRTAENSDRAGSGKDPSEELRMWDESAMIMLPGA